MQELSRREREKQRRRDEILQAAWEVFSSRDYDSATIDDIAATAELSKGAVYLYFQNKADLFLSTAEMGMDKISSIIQEVVSSSEDPVLGLREIIRRMLGFLEENVGFFKILSSERSHFEMHAGMADSSGFKERVKGKIFSNIDIIADYVERGIEMGVFRRIDPRDVALSVLEMIRGFAFARLMAPVDFELSEKVESISSILMDGIRERDRE